MTSGEDVSSVTAFRDGSRSFLSSCLMQEFQKPVSMMCPCWSSEDDLLDVEALLNLVVSKPLQGNCPGLEG